MYTFVDQLNGESLTLRPEGTASCVRAAIQHSLLYSGPCRVFYSGPMFRHERPQKGRFRQFHQYGVEALGFPGPDIDAEHMVMGARLWQRLGLKDIQLEINSLGSSESRGRYRARLIAYLESRLDELDQDAQRRLHTNPLRVLDSKNPSMLNVVEEAPRLADDLDDESAASFEQVQSLLREAGISYVVNPRLVRGLDYYNDAVYEWTTTRLGAQGTVCAGGRYDGLFTQIGGKPATACGFAMGVERLLALLGESASMPELPVADVYVVHAGVAGSRYAWKVAEMFRDASLDVILHCGGGSFKSQMKRADNSGARFAAIIGDNEAQAGEVSIKPLRGDGAQQTATVGAAIEQILGSGSRIRTRSKTSREG
jgi:histidyl-tRNA synthetase